MIRVRNGSNSSAPILEEYTSDPYGDRVKINRYDSANTTVYTPYREWTQIRNSSGVYDFTYIYDGSTLVARINPDGSKHYFHDDHLGSVSLITNQSGAIIEQTFFEPFGSVMAGGTAEDKLYTGQFADELTGQYYYGARYYIPIRGQFGQADPIIQSAYNPQALNRYSYVWNNPYLYIDPDGRLVVTKQEFYKGEEITSISEDGFYIGRVASAIQQTITFPSHFEGGQDVSITQYDYVVQRGSKLIDQYGNDYIGEYFEPKEYLSEITLRNQERVFKQENLDLALALAYDATSGLSSIVKGTNFFKVLSSAGSGGSILAGIRSGDKADYVGAVPYLATASWYFLKDYNGYRPYTQIKEYKGTYKIGRIGGGEVVVGSDGSTEVRWGKYGRGDTENYCIKECDK